VPATVFPLEGERAKVVFDVPQTAIAPGQVVTVYEDDVVLGGGWIEAALEQPSGGSTGRGKAIMEKERITGYTSESCP
jgi:hypothetical protein